MQSGGIPARSEPLSPETRDGGPDDAAPGGGPPPVRGGIPDLQLPDVHIVREIARGGFGVVYEAQQSALNRTVAVKLLLAEVHDEKVRLRFARECTAMGLLSDHPHIVTVFDAGFSPTGQPYILMDFLPGGSLADVIDAEGPIAWPEVLSITVKLACALETAHRAGVLHRDVKPENVLRSSYGEPELGDFGIARLAGGPETRTDTLTASIAHVAPELLAGSPPSIATDLYALGSTCYVLLCGRLAFLRDTDDSIVPALTRISSEPVPDLRADGIPDEVAALVERLMAKDPADRFASPLALAVHVQEIQRRLGLVVTPVHVPGEPSFPEGRETGAVDVATALDRTVPPAVDGQRSEATGRANPPPVPAAEDAGPAVVGGTGPASPPPVPTEDDDDNATVRTVRPGEEAGEPTAPLPVDRPRGRRRWALAAAACVAVAAVAVAGVLVLGGEPEADPVASEGDDGAGAEDDSQADVGDLRVAEDGGQILDATQMAVQVSEVRGLPLRGNFDVRRYPADLYGPLIREYAGGSQRDALDVHGQVLAALRLIPRDLDYPEMVRDLWEEQLNGFYDESVDRAYLRGEGTTLSALERKILADELIASLIDSAFDVGALHDATSDADADRALTALIKGDTFLSSTVWAERFLTAEESTQAESDLHLLPDTVGRSAPRAAVGEFLFPFVAGEDFVRTLFAEGGVEALDAAYDDPPTTTEQIIHPEKYLAREPAIPVEGRAAPPGDGWTELVRRTFGEHDLQQLLAELGEEEALPAAAGWGGGTLVAWTRGEETAVAVWLEMDTPEDGAAACEAVPVWYALSGGAPGEANTFTSPEDAMALACDGASVRFAVAPDGAVAHDLLG